ncbi:MAG: DoxX family membrane protein [Armatimonadetes bacterium]|nr:DoxX family membrane protein [Armatimonadota bacterium]
MSILRNDYLHLLIRLIMGGLFIYAGWGKILAPLDFASSIYNYKLFPDFVAGLAAATVPWIEFLAGFTWCRDSK